MKKLGISIALLALSAVSTTSFANGSCNSCMNKYGYHFCVVMGEC